MKTYDKLSRPLKDRAAFYKKRHDPQSCIGDWREMRKVIGGYLTPVANGRCEDGSIWIEDSKPLRNVRPAHKVVNLRHTGWYTDDYNDGLTHGIVTSLPHGRFMAGHTDPWNDGPVRVDLSIYATERDAAYAADRMAELYAEECRESDRKSAAEQEILEREDEIAGIREQVVALVRSIRKSTLDSVVCERLREDVREMLAEKTRLYARIEELEGSL